MSEPNQSTRAGGSVYLQGATLGQLPNVLIRPSCSCKNMLLLVLVKAPGSLWWPVLLPSPMISFLRRTTSCSVASVCPARPTSCPSEEGGDRSQQRLTVPCTGVWPFQALLQLSAQQARFSSSWLCRGRSERKEAEARGREITEGSGM